MEEGRKSEKAKKERYEVGEIRRCKGRNRGRKVEIGGEIVGQRDSIVEKSTLFDKSFLPNGSVQTVPLSLTNMFMKDHNEKVSMIHRKIVYY